MTTYAIGDLQGCLEPLERLLTHIQFNPKKDTLWFTGDLVNRGPQSLETLRYVKNLSDQHKIVLGNHDLHLLARAHHAHPGWPDDTLDDILQASDKIELLEWLTHHPLIHHDEKLNYALVHAGLASNWDLNTALRLSQEIETVIRGEKAAEFFRNMYGNMPDHWDENLEGWDRLRCITNFFTRLRFCYPDGRMELKNKGAIGSLADELIPWFKVSTRANANINILFGHWAALAGITNTPHTFALDTGCIWGYSLTAMNLSTQERFSVPASKI